MTTSPSPNTWTIPTVTSSTNLGPLTTPFSLPPDCLQKLYDLQIPGLIPGALYTYYTEGYAISPCCPSSTPYTSVYACKNPTLPWNHVCPAITDFRNPGVNNILHPSYMPLLLSNMHRATKPKLVRVVLSIPLGVWR